MDEKNRIHIQKNFQNHRAAGWSLFMAARTRYFVDIDEARFGDTKIFWHDETWCNKNEERPFVWTDGMTGSGRLRQSKSKGKYLF